MPPKKDPKRTGIYVAIAIVMMVTIHLTTWSKPESTSTPVQDKTVSQVVFTPVEDMTAAGQLPAHIMVYDEPDFAGMDGLYTLKDDDVSEVPNSDAEDFISEDIVALEGQGIHMRVSPLAEKKSLTKVDPKPMPNYKRTWEGDAAAFTTKGGGAKIVIIIDDLGMDKQRTQAIVDINGPLTLAYLPYAHGLKDSTDQAKAKGHELIIHMPMEPMNGDINPGRIALLDNMSADELREQLNSAFGSFDGYIGINNHMGSRITQNRAAMEVVMAVLAEKGLAFVDSKTISTSVAADTARQYGLDMAERDVFIDHVESDNFVAEAFLKLERIAKTQGYAIGIGHPKDVTIRGLKAWLPTLRDRGFVLAPVSAVLKNSGGYKHTALAIDLSQNKNQSANEKMVLSSDMSELYDAKDAEHLGAQRYGPYIEHNKAAQSIQSEELLLFQ